MKVSLVDYNESWAEIFAEEQALLAGVLTDTKAQIEHIGSTAVVGLSAKPVIDIMIGIEDFSLADSLVPKIVAADYDYIKAFETEMPYRRYFTRRVDGDDTHHIHMVAIGSEFWLRLLLFRDYLREHKNVRDEYANLKSELAKLEWPDVDDYAEAKTAFIRRTEKAAEAFFQQTIPELQR